MAVEQSKILIPVNVLESNPDSVSNYFLTADGYNNHPWVLDSKGDTHEMSYEDFMKSIESEWISEFNEYSLMSNDWRDPFGGHWLVWKGIPKGNKVEFTKDVFELEG